MKMKIRKGDRVRVMRGAEEDKGKVGEVIRVFPKENRLTVQGVNVVKKHQKQTQSGGKNIPSGILEFEAPIHISNVAKVTESEEKAPREGKTRAAKPAAKAAKGTKETKTAAKKTSEKSEKTAKPAAKRPTRKSGSGE